MRVWFQDHTMYVCLKRKLLHQKSFKSPTSSNPEIFDHDPPTWLEFFMGVKLLMSPSKNARSLPMKWNYKHEKTEKYFLKFTFKSFFWQLTREKNWYTLNIVNTTVRKVTIPGKFENFARETLFFRPWWNPKVAVEKNMGVKKVAKFRKRRTWKANLIFEL